VLNAFESGERIVIDVVRYRELWRSGNDAFGPTTLHRFTVDRRPAVSAKRRWTNARSNFRASTSASRKPASLRLCGRGRRKR